MRLLTHRGPAAGRIIGSWSQARARVGIRDAARLPTSAGALPLLGWIANAAGAFVVFQSVGFLIPIFLDPDRRTELGLLNAPVLVALLVFGGLVLARYGDRHLATAARLDRRGPGADDEEHRLTLRLAEFGAKLVAIGWLLAGASCSRR